MNARLALLKGFVRALINYDRFRVPKCHFTKEQKRYFPLIQFYDEHYSSAVKNLQH
jgi:hypothetical protein